MTETQELYRGVWATTQRGDAAGRRHVARGHRGGDGLAHPPRRPRAGPGVRPLRAPARRDRRARAWPRCTRSRCRGGRCSRRRSSRRRSCASSPHLLALVQGDTSTTMLQPLDEIGAICAKHGVLFYTRRDRVAGRQRRSRWTRGAWTPRPPACRSAWRARRAARRSRLSDARGRGDPVAHAGSRPASARSPTRTPASLVRSNYFDLGMILDYWGPRRLNHHTEATSMLYARARVRARHLLEEGRRGRHRPAPSCTARAMLAGVRGLGLAVFGDVAHKMNNVVAVEIPDGVRRRRRRAARCCRTSASRSARRSGRCTAASGASARWATTRAWTPCCTTLAALEHGAAPVRRVGARRRRRRRGDGRLRRAA